MGAIAMGTTMDALATAAPAGITRKFGYPVEAIEPPTFVVGYPTTVEFDVTFGRGSDRAVYPVWYIVDNVVTKAARDKLSAVLPTIKNALDALAATRVMTVALETVTVGAVQYISARFDVEVYS